MEYCEIVEKSSFVASLVCELFEANFEANGIEYELVKESEKVNYNVQKGNHNAAINVNKQVLEIICEDIDEVPLQFDELVFSDEAYLIKKIERVVLTKCKVLFMILDGAATNQIIKEMRNDPRCERIRIVTDNNQL